MRPDAMLTLLALGAIATLLLLASTWMAFRARQPAKVRFSRGSFEHGRRLARDRRPNSTDAALAALRDAPVGKVLRARSVVDGYEVAVERKRRQACLPATGFVAGLFESAWAHDVHVDHKECAGPKGGQCVYLVRPLNTGARPAAAASTRG